MSGSASYSAYPGPTNQSAPGKKDQLASKFLPNRLQLTIIKSAAHRFIGICNHLP